MRRYNYAYDDFDDDGDDCPEHGPYADDDCPKCEADQNDR